MAQIPQPPSDDEIQARLRRAAEKARLAADNADDAALLRRIREEMADLPAEPSPIPAVAHPDDDPEFAARLRELDARAAKARAIKVAEVKQSARVEKQTRSDTGNLKNGMAIAYAIIGMPAIGSVLGLIVAKVFNMPVATSAGGFIGILVGCLVAFRFIRLANKEP
jgi:F0F1-type ATP synthase assembly protein I